MNKRKYIWLFTILLSFSLIGCKQEEESSFNMAEEALSILDYDVALQYFEAAKEENSDSRSIARGMGIAYLGKTQYEEAIICFEEALSLSNGFVQEFDYDVNYYLASAYAKNNEIDKAIAVYNAILALRDDAQTFYLRGILQVMKDEITLAQEDFDQAVLMDAKDYDMRIQIYQLLANSGNEEIGFSYLRTALNENNDISSYDKGRMYYYLGEYENAYLSLESAKDLKQSETYLYLGKAYEASGDYNYAALIYQTYIEQDGTNAQMYNQLGLCELNLKDYLSALTAFQTGLTLEVSADMLQVLEYNEIIAYEYLQDYEMAKEKIESYMKKYPFDEEAKREYEFLMTR